MTDLTFSQQIELVFQDGQKSGTHKFALIRGILDYSIEKPPVEGKDYQIPLSYIAYKHITYYWKMFIHNKVKQVTKGNIGYYKFLKVIGKYYINKDLKEHHIHEINDLLFRDEIPKKVHSQINQIRKLIFDMPLDKCKNITRTKKSGNEVQLDFYNAPETYIENTNKEPIDYFFKDPLVLTIPARHIQNLNIQKELLLYTTKLHWALETDKYTEQINSGVQFLADIQPQRGSLRKFLELYEEIGITTCQYCSSPATTIDHVFPFRLCCRDDFWNLVPACKSCNSTKSDKLLKMSPGTLDTLTKFVGFIVKNNLEDFQGQINYKSSIDGNNLRQLSNEDLSKYLINDTIFKVGVEGIELST